MGVHVRLLRKPRAWGLVAAVVIVSQVVPTASRAYSNGSIAGSVEDVGGSAIRDICVDVFDIASGTATLQTVTDANGMYRADDLPASDYQLHFTDCLGPDDYAPQWNGGERDRDLAPPVTVAVGATVQVNAAMDRWGEIHGSVEDVGGSAIRDICVRALDIAGHGAGWSRTDANGMYTLKIRSLFGTATYKVRFYDCSRSRDFAPEWNEGVRSEQLATPVTREPGTQHRGRRGDGSVGDDHGDGRGHRRLRAPRHLRQGLRRGSPIEDRVDAHRRQRPIHGEAPVGPPPQRQGAVQGLRASARLRPHLERQPRAAVARAVDPCRGRRRPPGRRRVGPVGRHLRDRDRRGNVGAARGRLRAGLPARPHPGRMASRRGGLGAHRRRRQV